MVPDLLINLTKSIDITAYPMNLLLLFLEHTMLVKNMQAWEQHCKRYENILITVQNNPFSNLPLNWILYFICFTYNEIYSISHCLNLIFKVISVESYLLMMIPIVIFIWELPDIFFMPLRRINTKQLRNCRLIIASLWIKQFYTLISTSCFSNELLETYSWKP